MLVLHHYIYLLLLFTAHSAAAESIFPVIKKLNIEYGMADGQSLKLDVFIPDDSGTTQPASARPAIILVHGGGWAAGNRAAFHRFAQWFAQRGYVSFSVGYRLVKGTKNTWPAQLDDVQLAVRWARAHAAEYRVDPQKIGALGGSAGGHLVSMLATRDTHATGTIAFSSHSSKVKCAVNFAGPSDLSADFPTSRTGRLDVQALVDGLLGGPRPKRSEVARDASPINFVSADDSPVLIVHGDRDKIVPLEHATRFHEALRKAGVDSKLIVLKNEGHGLKPEHDRLFRRESRLFYEQVFKAPTVPK